MVLNGWNIIKRKKKMLNNIDLLTAANYVTKLSLIKDSPKIYISGPVSMYNDNDYALKTFIDFEHKVEEKTIKGEAFNNGTLKLKYPVTVNPVSFNLSLCGVNEMDWADFMVYDLMILNQCDYIIMMDNWEKSEGAKMEKDFAGKTNRIKELRF